MYLYLLASLGHVDPFCGMKFHSVESNTIILISIYSECLIIWHPINQDKTKTTFHNPTDFKG